MNQIKNSILSAFLVFTSSSCIQDVDLEHLRPDPKLVLNSITTVNEPVTATVSRTWFYTENHPNVTIKDAELNLYVNDLFQERLTWKENKSEYNSKGYYTSSYKLSQGDKIRLEAKAKGFKDVFAESLTPPKAALKKFTIERVIKEEVWGGTTKGIIYRVTISDDPRPDNCYLIRLKLKIPAMKWEEEKYVFTGEYYYSTPDIDYLEEPVFGDKITVMDKLMGNDWLSGRNGRPFSDELFNGKEYTLKLRERYYNGGYYPPTDPSNPTTDEKIPSYCTVYLYSISESYYKYLSSLTEIDDLSFGNDLISAGLAEPVRVFSNVQGGTGIIGTACVDSLTVEIPE